MLATVRIDARGHGSFRGSCRPWAAHRALAGNGRQSSLQCKPVRCVDGYCNTIELKVIERSASGCVLSPTRRTFPAVASSVSQIPAAAGARRPARSERARTDLWSLSSSADRALLTCECVRAYIPLRLVAPPPLVGLVALLIKDRRRHCGRHRAMLLLPLNAAGEPRLG